MEPFDGGRTLPQSAGAAAKADFALKALCRDYSADMSAHVIADHPLSESLPEGVTVQTVSPEEMEELFQRFHLRKQLKGGSWPKDFPFKRRQSDDRPAGSHEHRGCEQRLLCGKRRRAKSPPFPESGGGGEIARQIRLRNLSGMILIDFIDMDREDERRQVQEAMEQSLGDDRVKTVVHGFTRLGILEITRKRTGETLQEMLTEPCRACGRNRPRAGRMAVNGQERTYTNLEHHALM